MTNKFQIHIQGLGRQIRLGGYKVPCIEPISPSYNQNAVAYVLLEALAPIQRASLDIPSDAKIIMVSTTEDNPFIVPQKDSAFCHELLNFIMILKRTDIMVKEPIIFSREAFRKTIEQHNGNPEFEIIYYEEMTSIIKTELQSPRGYVYRVGSFEVEVRETTEYYAKALVVQTQNGVNKPMDIVWGIDGPLKVVKDTI